MAGSCTVGRAGRQRFRESHGSRLVITRVKVELDGVALYGEEVKIVAGMKKPFIIRLEPAVASRPDRNDSSKVGAQFCASGNEEASETNPWPGGLRMEGQTIPVEGRFAAISRDCRRVALVTPTMELWVFDAPDAAQDHQNRGASERLHLGRRLQHRRQVRGQQRRQRWLRQDLGHRERQRSSPHPGRGPCIVYSPDGTRLACAAGVDKAVYVWDAASGEKLATFGPLSSRAWCVAFSPDGKRVASGTGHGQMKEGPGVGELKVWDLGNRIGTNLEGHQMSINSVAFSPDGERLAGASEDSTVKIWNLATKKCLVSFDKHHAIVNAVRFSPDSRLVASVGDDDSARIWDASTGQELASLMGLPGIPTSSSSAPRCHWIYAGGGHTLRACETPSGVDPELTLRATKPRETVINSIGMKLNLIPAGEFVMGSPDDDKEADTDEKPQHRVRITRPFYLGVYRSDPGPVPRR